MTRNPKTEAGKELWQHTLSLKKSDRGSFTERLQRWFKMWELFLNEQKIDEKGKKRYVHKKLRSVYSSLHTNLSYLFTWQDKKVFNIPNTTNAIDGVFAHLKNKLRNHSGLSMTRKQKFIDEFFLRHRELKVYYKSLL